MHAAWKPGQSGNPLGRRAGIQKTIYEVMNIAEGHAPEALRSLRRTALNPNATATVRIAAAEAILNRAYGPPNVAFQILARDTSRRAVSKVSSAKHRARTPAEVQSEVLHAAEVGRILRACGALAALIPPNPTALAANSNDRK
jgi:hypothetical protein